MVGNIMGALAAHGTQATTSNDRTHRSPASAPYQEVALLTFALAVLGTWQNVVGYSAAYIGAGESAQMIHRLGVIMASALFVGFPAFLRSARPALNAIVPALMSACTLVYGFAYHQDLLPPEPLSVLGGFVLGTTYIWFVLTLYATLANIASLRVAEVAVVVSAVLEQLFGTGLAVIASDTEQLVACMVLPPLGGVAMWKAGRTRKQLVGKSCVVKRRAAARVTNTGRAEHYQVALLITMGLASATMAWVSPIGAWGSARPDYTDSSSLLITGLACLMLVAVACPTLIWQTSRPLGSRYRPAFAVMVLGYLVTCFVALPANSATMALALMLEFYGHAAMWVIAVDAVQCLRFDPYRIIGLTGIAPLSRMAWQVLDGGNPQIVVAAVLVATLIVTVAVPLAYNADTRADKHLRTERTGSGLGSSPIETIPGDSRSTGAILMQDLERRCAYLANDVGLTDRESNILFLLSQGMTHSNIQERLCLSESTVKTHLRHIYAKFNVAAGPELMAIVFQQD